MQLHSENSDCTYAYAFLVVYAITASHWVRFAYNWLYDMRSGRVCLQCRRATSTAHRRQISSPASRTHTCASWSTKASTRTAPCGRCISPKTTCSWHATFSSSLVGVDRRPHMYLAVSGTVLVPTLFRPVHMHCCSPRHVCICCYLFGKFLTKTNLVTENFSIFSVLVTVFCSYLYWALSSSVPLWNSGQQVSPAYIIGRYLLLHTPADPCACRSLHNSCCHVIA